MNHDDNVQDGRKPALMLALCIGFLPSVLMLGIFTLPPMHGIGSDRSDSTLWSVSIVSVICCFTASAMLFSRRTGGAFAGGVFFLLLNGFIAFFAGCSALMP